MTKAAGDENEDTMNGIIAHLRQYASPFRLGLIAGAVSLLAAVALPWLYASWGAQLITDAYNGRSWEFLNRMAALRSYHPLEEFHAWAETLVSEAVVALVVLGLVLTVYAAYSRLARLNEHGHRNVLLRIDALVFASGVAASAVAVWLLPGAYHALDVATFIDWQGHMDQSLAEIYVACESCNYPIVGTLLSAGFFEAVAAFAPNLDPTDSAQLFRYFLSIFDGLNVVLLYILLRAVGVNRSLFWAGLVGILPSSWVGAAVWAQIDGITQSFLLLFLLVQARFVIGKDSVAQSVRGASRGYAYAVASGLLLAGLLLTKQLAIFSIPVLFCLFLTSLYFMDSRRILPLTGIVVAVTLAGVLAADPFLSLKEGYFSHLQYIFFGGGSAHGNKIAGNGFNIWVLLGRDMSSASTDPFFGALTPRDTGVILFLVFEAFVFSFLGVALLRFAAQPPSPAKRREVFLLFVFLLALTNLAFNVLVSGTHERYLFHFYPFILLAWLGLRRSGMRLSTLGMGILVAGAVFYGRFVWGILSPSAIVIPQEFAAVFHLGLFAMLTVAYTTCVRASWATDYREESSAHADLGPKQSL